MHERNTVCVFDILQTPSGCSQVCSGCGAPTCTALLAVLPLVTGCLRLCELWRLWQGRMPTLFSSRVCGVRCRWISCD